MLYNIISVLLQFGQYISNIFVLFHFDFPAFYFGCFKFIVLVVDGKDATLLNICRFVKSESLVALQGPWGI